MSITLLVILFPDGHLPDRSLRAAPWVAVGGGAASILWAVTAEDVFGRYSLRNPLHVGGILGDVVDGFGRLGTAALLISFVVAIITVFIRLGSAQGVERQRLKWFAYAAAVLLGVLFLFPVFWFLPGWLSFPLGIALFSTIPVAVGFAVLKYRLYDIDRIINRTLVYGAAGSGLLRRHPCAARDRQPGIPGSFSRAHRPREPTRHHSRNPGDSCALHTSEASPPVVHRQALLPQQVRHQEDTGNLLGPAA
jgi:hypothetical protein